MHSIKHLADRNRKIHHQYSAALSKLTDEAFAALEKERHDGIQELADSPAFTLDDLKLKAAILSREFEPGDENPVAVDNLVRSLCLDLLRSGQ